MRGGLRARGAGCREKGARELVNCGGEAPTWKTLRVKKLVAAVWLQAPSSKQGDACSDSRVG